MWHRKAPPSIDISILARGASFLYALFDYGFTTNREYWYKKLNRNKERDKEVNEYYKKKNWNLKRIWEHEIKEDLDRALDNLIHFIEESRTKR